MDQLTGVAMRTRLDTQAPPSDAGRSVSGSRMPDGRTGEAFVGSSADRDEQFDWRSWCDSVNAYLHQLEAVLHPDLIVIGGGVSIERDVAHWMGLLRTRATVTAARFRNFAGVVGAAMAAAGQAGVPE